MRSTLRPLLPSAVSAPSGNQLPSSSRQLPKRRQVPVACEHCRSRKVRCDGKRPSCTPCQTRRTLCVYPPEESTAAGIALLKNRADLLKQENVTLLNFFRSLGELPKHEAADILAKIRATEDPMAILRLARDVSASLRHGPDPASEAASSDPRLRAADLRALLNSPLRLSARPWTVVAGNGLVSDLIASFFVWDDPFFFPFIDREAFLEDMRSNDIEKARYCSPFLVNAMCASRCFTSPAAKFHSSVTGEDLSARFVNEAKKLWDQEAGRASLPTVQGLAILFTVTAYRGTDKQGFIYRYAAYEMLHRLGLPHTFKQSSPNDGQASRSREEQIVSKVIWGLFCFESIVGYVYLQQSLLKPPNVPRCFEPAVSSNCPSVNLDFNGEPFTSTSTSPPFVPGILDATCELSLALYEVMQWNADSQEPGSEIDLTKRRQFYAENQSWRHRLQRHLTAEGNFTPQTCFLHVYADEVIISILRPLHSRTMFDQARNALASDLLIERAMADAELVKKFLGQFKPVEYSCMTLCGLYNAILILVEYLEDARVPHCFVEVCIMIRRTVRDFPMARFILQGVMAMAWSLDVAVPARSLPYLQGLGAGNEEPADTSLAFALPPIEAMRNLLREDGEVEALVEMGQLLEKWNAMSIE
ncbi:hypothetical protein XA68_17449 [Ophiocordyceps unilateralis]|uniref:Zn(2)-C6 fungal-type domain-containing protein n=1 Tax=Ophiocordyceps unilateralis TaxID=268505 RepID=A0A2A9PKH4_OPHUN|nr:hypothetical protein XA68_17449 [Ophiocordyceps unilateralis]